MIIIFINFSIYIFLVFFDFMRARLYKICYSSKKKPSAIITVVPCPNKSRHSHCGKKLLPNITKQNCAIVHAIIRG